MSIRDTTSLAAATVTDFSMGRVRALRTPRRLRTSAEVTPAQRSVHRAALAAALRAAGGDRSRLWFDADGAVWTLNHARTSRCTSRACPACRSGEAS